MIETRNQDNKLFQILCMKEPYYVMNIMASWITLDQLEGAKTRKYFIDSRGTKDTKQFTCRQPFALHFRYIHQVEDHNNQLHERISLERTHATKFWTDHNFALHVDMSEVNTYLVPGHFQNDGVVQQSLYFWRALAM